MTQAERPLFPAGLGDIHPPDRTGRPRFGLVLQPVGWAPVGEVNRRGPVKMTCSCSPRANGHPQRILRVTCGVADEGQIRCEIRRAEFVRVPG